MKVVYLSPSGQMGGAEWSLLHLLGGLREQPHFTPFVVLSEAGPLAEHCQRLGIAHAVLPYPEALAGVGDSRERRGLLSQGTTWLNAARVLGPGCAYAGRLRTLLARERPDVIHSNGFKMHLAAAWIRRWQRGAQRAALVAHIHDYVSPRPLAGKALRLAAPQFARFVANSQSVAADLRNYLGTSRVEAVHNAIDLIRFAPEGSRLDLDRQCGLPAAAPGTLRVGLVATFARWKGHFEFLQALARLDRGLAVRGYVIGGAIYRTAGSQVSLAELQAEVERLGLKGQVGFTGFVEDTAAALRALDIVVHASTQPEPFGMAIIEAMACGKAAIVSALGGARELFEERRTALGHTPGDVAQLAGQMNLLARNPQLREELGRRAWAAVRTRFQPSEMAARFRRVYEEVAAQPEGAARKAAGASL